MVQRSTTCVISSEGITDIGLTGLHDEQGPPAEGADMWFWGMPAEWLKSQQVGVTAIQNKHKETITGLEKSRFKVDMDPNGARLLMKYFQRGGGCYIDVGARQLVIDGHIKIKQGSEIGEVQVCGLQVCWWDAARGRRDYPGSRLPRHANTDRRCLFGDETADDVGDVWGFDDTGEMRGIRRPSEHKGLWFIGGTLAISRYYSRIQALQIKAAEVGLS
ncbi:hypothetical protein BDW68DRAFT_179846 [Aspergillus falconensis]